MTLRDDARQPRAASTVVILREGGPGPEVLMTTRPKHMRFMGGAAVFPGGAVASFDRDPRWRSISTLAAAEAARLLDEPDQRTALGSFICALREAFEEVGFLLADGPGSELSRDDAEDPETFLRRCTALGLTLRTDLLMPAGRWVTPLGSTVRFDARFFVAEAPSGWEPVPDPREVDRCWWTTPTEALAELSASDLLMAPPTIEMLQQLEGHENLTEIRAALSESPVGNEGALISVRLSPLVHVVLAPNPGVMTGPGTNTYVVGSGPTCVIDPAVEDEPYLDAVCRAAGEVSHILITHRHSDHVGGAAALARRTGARVHAWGADDAGGARVTQISDGQLFDVGGASLEALHTPGHASDHLAFYLRGAASLFAGDNVLGEGTAVIAPPDGNMRSYLSSLKRLRTLHIDRIYPGHFRPLDGGAAVIDGYLAHREMRRLAVIDALGRGHSTEEAIVELVYADTPPQLHPVAVLQVRAMLEMLEEDGLVRSVEDRWETQGVE